MPKAKADPQPGSQLEAELILICKAANLPAPVLQYQICNPARRWQYDLCWPEHLLAVEVQGGIWMRRGAHNTGGAITRDCEKSNEAQLRGWLVLHVTKDHIDNGQAVAWIGKALEMREWWHG